MSFKIDFIHKLEYKIPTRGRNTLSILKISKENFNDKTSLINDVTLLFNAEILWEGMWDIKESHIRFNSNKILYLLLESGSPLGCVWYNSSELYNAFVSKERRDGDSAWFIQETMWDMKQEYNLEQINLCVDDWNQRAIKFWKKLGFEFEPFFNY